MKLKTAVKIQKVLYYIIIAIFLLFGIIGIILEKILSIFSWIISVRDNLLFKIGNKLLLMSVESAEIKNEYYLKSITAGMYLEYLKEIEKNKN